MPTNLYGPHDNYDLETSHVLAALINKITYAKKYKKESVEIWGTGKPKRDFLHVDDLADAVCFLAENYSSSEPINVGSSKEISIKELAETIAKLVGWNGSFLYKKEMPDGTLLKRLDTTKINKLGWQSKIDFKTGIRETLREYKTL
jgi:GDP-L-fucose synthase